MRDGEGNTGTRVATASAWVNFAGTLNIFPGVASHVVPPPATIAAPDADAPGVSVFQQVPAVTPRVRGTVIPVGSVVGAVGIYGSVLFLPRFCASVSAGVDDFYLGFCRGKFAFSVVLRVF